LGQGKAHWLLFAVWDETDLLQPDRGFGVAGGAVVPAWGERATRTDLGGVGYAGALELADLEEAPGKDFEPVLDLTNRVLMTALPPNVRSALQVAIVPGAIGQEGYLRRSIAQAGGVVHEEVMQFV